MADPIVSALGEVGRALAKAPAPVVRVVVEVVKAILASPDPARAAKRAALAASSEEASEAALKRLLGPTVKKVQK